MSSPHREVKLALVYQWYTIYEHTEGKYMMNIAISFIVPSGTLNYETGYHWTLITTKIYRIETCGDQKEIKRQWHKKGSNKSNANATVSQETLIESKIGACLKRGASWRRGETLTHKLVSHRLRRTYIFLYAASRERTCRLSPELSIALCLS